MSQRVSLRARIFVRYLGLLLWMAVLCPVAGAAAQKIDIRMTLQASVVDAIVHLGEIAEIHGGTQMQLEKLRKLPIGKAPLPGQSRSIDPSHVELRLKQHGLDQSNIHLIASGPVKVSRRYSLVSADQIKSAVRAYIQKNAPWDKRQLKIGPVQCRRDLKAPYGRAALTVSAPKHTDWLGVVPFTVRILNEGQTYRKIFASARIEVLSEVLMTTKPLGKNQPITRSDIQRKQMNLSRAPSDVIADPKQVLGQRTTRSIAAHSILRNDQVESPPVVRKGDIVQVLAESNTLKVTTQGMAQENGARGERIRVVNLRSKKTVYAQIVDRQTVRVKF